MGILVLTPIVQFIGIIIPIIGCVTLYRREQSKTAMCLMLTSVACFIINSTYLLLLWSGSHDAAFVALKVLYLGNALFYFSFILFIATYLEIGTSGFRLALMSIWGAIEGCLLFILWSGDPWHLVFKSIHIRPTGILGITSVQTTQGVVCMVRNAAICSILVIGMIYTTIKMFQMKVKEERQNLAKLCGAQFVIVVALHLSLLFRLPFDVTPICASLSILSIILGVIKGDFFRITDQARDWVVDHMDNALIITDTYYGYLDANEYAKAIFPMLRLIQKNQLVPIELQSLFTTKRENHEIGGHRYRKEVEPLIHKGKIVGHSLLLIDITEQCNLLLEIEAEKERAEEANKAKSMFMSNMSHEIRTPMNAIVGMTDILLREELSKNQREYLNNIKSSGNALLTIINDILDFSKIESGKMDIIEDEYEPMSMFNDLSMLFLNRIGEKHVELLYDIDTELPQKLYGDVQRIRQVVINLMNNAIKFTQEGSVTLSVKAKMESEEDITLSFYVYDTGQGIKEEDIGKLFGSFQQVDTKKNHHMEGTGLGLAIAKQLVELMGGSISVESTYGKGSCFSFVIPQKVRNAKKAAEIKVQDRERLVISARFDNSLVKEKYDALVQAYGITHMDVADAEQEKQRLEVFFTDDYWSIKDEEMSLFQKWNTRICVLHNPMCQDFSDIQATLVNKPLYSLNFCQVLNNEDVSFETEEHVSCFIAPQARVLVVDDNEMNLKVARGLLEPTRMQIDVAENGKIAIDMIQRNRYDMVFFDHMMPVMDGVEATQRIRQMEDEYYQKLPIIALSANATVEARELFKANGFNDFVAKPIKLKELCKCIRTWLPENYVENISQQTKKAVSDNTDTTTSDIPQMKGIDIAEGIANSGTKELFLQLLADFYKLIDQKSTKIEKCLADGMIRDYTIEVHALKSTARMIGAMELSEKFYRLEQLGNASEAEILKEKTPEVLALYRSYKTILEPFGRNNQNKQAVSCDKMIETLQQLKEAIDCFDLDGADEAMRQINGFEFPEDCRGDIECLDAYVADVAMEDIMNLVDTLVLKLQQSLN